MTKHNHYFKDVSHLSQIDVYRVLSLFDVTDPCVQHAVKKLLCAGIRGAKDTDKDLREARDSIERALAMRKEDAGEGVAPPQVEVVLNGEAFNEAAAEALRKLELIERGRGGNFFDSVNRAPLRRKYTKDMPFKLTPENVQAEESPSQEAEPPQAPESDWTQAPDWPQAPKWAHWWAVDKNGDAFWYALKPEKGEDLRWTADAGEWQLCGEGPVTPRWYATLTARPKEAPEPQDGSDWITWNGGERPVPGKTRVKVCFRAGDLAEGEALSFRWFRTKNSLRLNPQRDIIAYRLEKAAEPQDGDWIAWNGGECPIPDAKAGEFSLKMRGSEGRGAVCHGDASEMHWGHDGSFYDIIAYRLPRPAPESVYPLDAGYDEASGD